MNRERAGRILQEYETVRDPAGDPELEALKAAVFIEDVFGILLSESEIDPQLLGSADAMRGLVLGKLGTD